MSCSAVTSDLHLSCWGLNDAGQATPPLAVATIVCTSPTYGCALRNDHTLVCFGAVTSPLPPQKYSWITMPSSAGGICGFPLNGGAMVCSGFNGVVITFGYTLEITELTSSALRPLRFTPTIPFQFASGGAIFCSILTDSSLECDGYTGYPAQISPPAGAFVQLAVGDLYSCGTR